MLPLRPTITACMTNPPFYNIDEIVHANPNTICTGSHVEMRTVGGEIAFLLAILFDSVILRHYCFWYTCMVGKKSTLSVLLDALKSLAEGHEQSIDASRKSNECEISVRVVRFTQGKTMRW